MPLALQISPEMVSSSQKNTPIQIQHSLAKMKVRGVFCTTKVETMNMEINAKMKRGAQKKKKKKRERKGEKKELLY